MVGQKSPTYSTPIDALFMGEWSAENVSNLNRLLRCFSLASGLKINLSKTHIFSINVSEVEVDNVAVTLKCKKGSTPFVYLGLPVGDNMKRIKSWKPIIDKFQARLSSWKAKSLSFAGRVVLVKAVLGSLPNYYLSIFKAPVGVLKILEGLRRRFLWGGALSNNKIRWVAWDNIMKPKRNGRLGVGSIEDLNLGLIAKWWWRYKSSSDQVWRKVIDAIHGRRSKDRFVPVMKTASGVWHVIGSINNQFQRRDMCLESKIVCKVGKGDTVKFWTDIWAHGVRLKDRFPRMFEMCRLKRVYVCDCFKILNNMVWWDIPWSRLPITAAELNDASNLWQLVNSVNVGVGTDVWMWQDQSGMVEFTVKTVRKELSRVDNLNSLQASFHWSRIVTPKVNCYVWRAVGNKIRTAETLAYRGFDLGDGLCKRCGAELEMTGHILIDCVLARALWWSVQSWLKIDDAPVFTSLQQLIDSCLKINRRPEVVKSIYAVALLTLWKLWISRNEKLFNDVNKSTLVILEEVKLESYLWMIKRGRQPSLDKTSWWNFSLYDNG